MKKIILSILWMALAGVLYFSCDPNPHDDPICLDCTITISGVDEVQPTFCGQRDEVDAKESEFQEIVDRENSIVGQSASMVCDKYFK